MAVSRNNLYAGPGKVYMGGVGLQAEGPTGAITLDVEQENTEVGASMFGRMDGTSGDTVMRLGLTPFDNWGALPLLFPSYIRTPVIGTRGPAVPDPAAHVWTSDQRLYSVTAGLVTKPPDLHLGTGKALYGAVEVTGVVGDGMEVGQPGAFYTLQTGQPDPGGAATMDDFVRGPWKLTWADTPGFTDVEAEDEWVLSPAVAWSKLPPSGLTRAFKLDSVGFTLRGKPVGPTHQQIDDALLIQKSGGGLGRRFGATGRNIMLVGPLGKTITLYNCSLVSAGYGFGGTGLGTGEAVWAVGMLLVGGAVQPMVVFSA